MKKFNVGDKVRLKDDVSPELELSEGVITEVNLCRAYPYRVGRYCFTANELELVEEPTPKFSVGDEVNLTNNISVGTTDEEISFDDPLPNYISNVMESNGEFFYEISNLGIGIWFGEYVLELAGLKYKIGDIVMKGIRAYRIVGISHIEKFNTYSCIYFAHYKHSDPYFYFDVLSDYDISGLADPDDHPELASGVIEQ